MAAVLVVGVSGNDGMNAPDLNRDIPGFGVPVIVVKTADETVQNNTLQDDDELKFYVEPYSTWRWNIYGQYSSGATPDFAFQITVPSGATGNFWTNVIVGGTATPVFGIYGTPIPADGFGVTLVGLWLEGLVIVGATAGFLTLQWAQVTTNASNTTVKKGSSLMAWNLTPYAVKP